MRPRSPRKRMLVITMSATTQPHNGDVVEACGRETRTQIHLTTFDKALNIAGLLHPLMGSRWGFRVGGNFGAVL